MFNLHPSRRWSIRLFLVSLLCVAACSLLAEEISFKGAEWDSLAIPLQIVPFYLRVDSPSNVTSVSLEMDMYIKGKFVKTISSGGLSWKEKPAPLKVDSAVYFKTVGEGKIEGTVVIEWNGSRGVSKFEVSESELPILKGSGFGGLTGNVQAPGRSAVFRVVAGGGGVQFSEDPIATAKDNPNSTVLIGYLKTE